MRDSRKDVALRVRIDEETKQALDDEAKDRGMKLSAVVREKLEPGGGNSSQKVSPGTGRHGTVGSGNRNSPPDSNHKHRWGPTSLVTGLKKCRECGKVSR